MKFNPGDIAWVRHWVGGDGVGSWNDWCLAVWEGVEQVVTVIEYVESEGYVKARVIGADGVIFDTPDDYLVDEKTADVMRREGLLKK